MGGRGASSGGAGGGGLQAHYEKENARISEFMNGKGNGTIEMENGQIIERYTMDEMKTILKDAKDAGEMWEDDAIVIRYTNGEVKYYGEGDDTSKIKLSNISGVIYENANTSAYAGKGVKIENYDEMFDNWGGDDWRLDFTKGR